MDSAISAGLRDDRPSDWEQLIHCSNMDRPVVAVMREVF